MKILFLGDWQDSSASGPQRYWAMEQCGAEMHKLDKQAYTAPIPYGRMHLAKLCKRPSLMLNRLRLEKDIIASCETIKPDIVWMEWPREIDRSVLKRLKQICPSTILISFQDDNPWGDRRGDSWMWQKYFQLVPEFDIHLVKRESDIKNLKNLGARHCRLWEHGIFSPLFHPAKSNFKKKHAVSFVGTAMDKRGELIAHLLESGIAIDVFGTLWSKRYKSLVDKYPDRFRAPVRGNDYADVIRSSLLSLIMVSDSNHDEWTMRSYEIPGCATAAVVPVTPTHRRIFTDLETAYFYNSPEDCADIIRKAVSDPNEATRVGNNALEHFQTENWRIESRMSSFLTELHSERKVYS